MIQAAPLYDNLYLITSFLHILMIWFGTFSCRCIIHLQKKLLWWYLRWDIFHMSYTIIRFCWLFVFLFLLHIIFISTSQRLKMLFELIFVLSQITNSLFIFAIHFLSFLYHDYISRLLVFEVMEEWFTNSNTSFNNLIC